MSLEGQRLGAALAEENARRARIHIPHATFSCLVSGKNIDDMGIEAWKACAAYFDGPRECERGLYERSEKLRRWTPRSPSRRGSGDEMVCRHGLHRWAPPAASPGLPLEEALEEELA